MSPRRWAEPGVFAPNRPSMLNSLLHTHPNDHTNLDQPWLNWSPNDPLSIIEKHPGDDVPDQVQKFLAMTAAGHRNRDPMPLPLCPVDTIGMSPKKAHEVARMVAYLKHVYLPALNGRACIVDVGSGQGYLCRAMAAELGVDVLGLDGNQVQTDGAELWSDGRRGKKRSANRAGGKVNYKTMRINSALDIVDAVGEWLQGPALASDSPTQVVLVALHACGSLTPDIIRACLGTTTTDRTWSFAGAVAVGCCYNLLNDSGACRPSSLHRNRVYIDRRRSICRLSVITKLSIPRKRTCTAPRPRSTKLANVCLSPSNPNTAPMERHSRNPTQSPTCSSQDRVSCTLGSNHHANSHKSRWDRRSWVVQEFGSGERQSASYYSLPRCTAKSH